MLFTFDDSTFKSTFKKTSCDKDSKLTLVQDDTVCYDFDKIAKFVTETTHRGDKPSSCDAFVMANDDGYLIEFKNTKASSIDGNLKKELAKKAYDSIFILAMTFCSKETVKEVCAHTSLIVVYNKNKGTTDITNRLSSSAKTNKPLPQFGPQIRNMKGVLYKEVYTMNVDEFLKFVKSNIPISANVQK